VSALTPPDWLARRASLSPHRSALLDVATGLSLDFAALEARTNRWARWLTARGVGPGDRVAVLARNRVEYVELLFACQKLGAVLQNLNWRLSGPELAALVADAEPTLLLYEVALEPAAVRAAQPALPLLALEGPEVASRAELDPGPLPPPPVGLEAPWVICYTGGTTGLPKGALLTQGNILFNAIQTVASWGLGQEDSAILNAPLFHTGGLNVFTAPLIWAGGASWVCGGFEAEQVFDLIERGATLFFGVPTMFQLLLAHPRWPGVDLTRLKVMISGGAPCPAPIFEAVLAKGVPFKTGYGLTEAGPNNFWLPDPLAPAKPGRVGRPLMLVQARLTDEDGAAITTPGRPGELQLKGPHVIPGYWRRPEATAALFTPDGWLRTGDLAEVDADGDYAICGRLKDLIISGGENIYPAEVESVLYAHPEVAEVAVLGVPDPRWGEVPIAVVVARGPLGAEALLAHAAAHLARYKVPKRVIFADALPKTGAGKLDKQALARSLVTAQ
jgi:fatty-acyl-CoA synthase